MLSIYLSTDHAMNNIRIFSTFHVAYTFQLQLRCLGKAPVVGASGHLRGAGLRDGFPFSPFVLLSFVAMDSESNVESPT